MRARIADAAGGNPLFITEMLALATAGGELEVPPTLRALLTARLDQLEPQERSVLERGAVEGEIFHRGAVQALAPDETEVLPRLAALVRHELIRPDRPQFPGEDGFRFRHLLIRDAAYDALPKTVRADLHRRFADWLESKTTLVELDELAGYHLEQAARYQAELGEPDDALTLRAGDRLLAAGRRALDRDDARAATGLLDRALTLTRPLRPDVHAELDLARALMQEPARAAAICDGSGRAGCARRGDETGAALARAMAALLPPHGRARLAGRARGRCSSTRAPARGDRRSRRAGPGVVGARLRRGERAWPRRRLGDGIASRRTAHSRLAGRPATPPPDLGAALCGGSRPADEALEILDRLLAEAPSPWLQLNRAWLLAMLDRGEEARQTAQEAYARLREQDDPVGASGCSPRSPPSPAITRTRADGCASLCEWLEAMEQFGFLGLLLRPPRPFALPARALRRSRAVRGTRASP